MLLRRQPTKHTWSSPFACNKRDNPLRHERASRKRFRRPFRNLRNFQVSRYGGEPEFSPLLLSRLNGKAMHRTPTRYSSSLSVSDWILSCKRAPRLAFWTKGFHAAV